MARAEIEGLPPHVQRLLEEGDQLSERVEKLSAFLKSDTFAALDAERQKLLNKQIAVMTDYLNILNDRLVLEGVTQS